MTMEVFKTEDTQGRGVLLSSDLVEICTNLASKNKTETVQPDGTKKTTEITTSGVGLDRAAGARSGKTPFETHLSHDVSRSFGHGIEKGKWTTITVVGTRGENAVYVNGEKIGSANNQMVCPLRFIGSPYGQSFVGKIRNLKIWNRALPPVALTNPQLSHMAASNIPENIALNCKVTASVSDVAYNLLPEYVTDASPESRWSSGKTGPQWLMIDLGSVRTASGVTIKWENAYAKKYAIETSTDGNEWNVVYTGEAKPGETNAQFPTVPARFVRLNLQEAANGWGYSIFNVEIYK
jgi:hypothetical protein